MIDDPIVEEVRRIRKELAAKHNHDLHAMFEDARKRQAESGLRVVRRDIKQNKERKANSEKDGVKLHPGR